MHRRKFIGTTFSASLFGIAGCSSDSDRDAGSDSTESTSSQTETGAVSSDIDYGAQGVSPADEAIEVLEANWEAFKNGDVEAYEDTYHSESPAQEEKAWEDEDYFPNESQSIVVESREVTLETETKVTFKESVQEDSQTPPSENEATLKTENGEWKMWEYIQL